MAEKWITAMVSIAVGITALASIAVLVSKQAQTGNVITGGASGLRDALCAALSPIGVQCGNLKPFVDSSITFPSGTTTFPGGGGAGAGFTGGF
jgi:hypothetical protein